MNTKTSAMAAALLLAGTTGAFAQTVWTSPSRFDVGGGAYPLDTVHTGGLRSSPSAFDVGGGAYPLDAAHTVTVTSTPLPADGSSEAPVQSANSAPPAFTASPLALAQARQERIEQTARR